MTATHCPSLVKASCLTCDALHQLHTQEGKQHDYVLISMQAIKSTNGLLPHHYNLLGQPDIEINVMYHDQNHDKC